MDRADGGTIPRRDLLLTLAEELDDLSASATSLQTTLGRIVERASDGDLGVNSVWHMQEIDRVQQTIDDIAAILRRAASDCGARVDLEDLFHVTRLGALRERLGGRDRTSVEKSGSVVLF